MKKIGLHIKKITLLFLLLTSSLAYALRSDRTQPAFVQADSAILNHKTGISHYQGHVKLTQGSTIITSEDAVTYTNAHNQLEKITATGSSLDLAKYTTLPDNSPFPFVAVGESIDYYPGKGYVVFMGDAEATQGQDQFAGPTIHYDVNHGIVTTPLSKTGKAIITIQPQQKITPP